MSNGVFVGFGFGAIQGGLFAAEAFRSGRFRRLIVAEIRPDVVQSIRRAGGRYRVNVARPSGREVCEVAGVEILNPAVPADRAALVAAVAAATEICTALPGVAAYDSIVPLLAEGLRAKATPCVIYTAENQTNAADILRQALNQHLAAPPVHMQILSTVIGKMSGVVTDPGEIDGAGLMPVTDGLSQAFLVEEFNHILISRITLPGFQRGITVFDEKDNLAPFQEAKLFGHNAVHALLGYLAHRRGCRFIAEAAADKALMAQVRTAFLEESGGALIARHHGADALFTAAGYQAYADDLLARMVNPWLRDSVARVIRDSQRKLAWNDRLIGTMRRALDAGITPLRFAQGAAIALELVAAGAPVRSRDDWLEALWPEPDEPTGRKQVLQELILTATSP